MVKIIGLFLLQGGKNNEKANDKNIIGNDDGNNDIYNAADNGISGRNKGTDNKRIRASDKKQDDHR